MNTLLQDVRFAIRSFVGAPRFTVPALVALALGIGSTSATFSVVRGVVLEPLPYDQPDRVVVVWESNLRRNRPRNVISAANLMEWRERSRSFDTLGAVGPARLTLVLDGQPEEVTGLVASSDVFATLGVQPALGRAYTAAEDEQGNDGVMVITHEFWQTRFGGRPDILGATLNANSRPRIIVGVMPPGFTIMGQRASFLMPYGWRVDQLRSATGRGSSFGLARLGEGVTFEQATSEMQSIAAALEREFPERNAGWSVAP